MGRRRDKTRRLIPEQDYRICRAICLCQLTMVLSCVAIVYLSVAIYSPSLKAFKSGFELEPVMCQTIDYQIARTNCPWTSCGEWCLTRSIGFCPQIHALVRRNGTKIQLNHCRNVSVSHCPMITLDRLRTYDCNYASECSRMQGLFTCRNGHCRNISDYFTCNYRADGPMINTLRDSKKLNGFFECFGIHCNKIRHPIQCDRYCPNINTQGINVLIMHDDSVLTANCQNAIAFNEARGNNPGHYLYLPEEFWSTRYNNNSDYLLTNCATIRRIDKNDQSIEADDCLNGTLLTANIFNQQSYINFTQFWYIYEHSSQSLDPTQRILPNQAQLLIYPMKRLYINVEGCVNTLRNECEQFVENYGRNGANNTAQSRYQCYYNRNSQVNYVVARYDLAKTYRDLLISFIIPIMLFILSFLSLIIITKWVKVGDDAKMRWICHQSNSMDNQDDTRHSSIVMDNIPLKKFKKNTDNPQQIIIFKNTENLSTTDTIATTSTKSLLPSNLNSEHCAKKFNNNDIKEIPRN